MDKLLEAGLSSFHCETARQAADRLGPLKVDVSDNSSESGSTNSAEQINQTNNTNSRLLQEAASGSDVNQNNSSKQQQNRKPKKLAKKVRSKASPGTYLFFIQFEVTTVKSNQIFYHKFLQKGLSFYIYSGHFVRIWSFKWR